MKGILLVDKPQGITSHDVVDRIRRAAGIRRVGHTGTLDPAATGLLVLCLGPATRLSEFLTGLNKVYEGTMKLGVATDSYDMDGTILEEKDVPPLDLQAIQEACNEFSGEIMQVPPMVSAVKVGGQRLYKMARKGETVERKPRQVTVYEFIIKSYQEPEALFRVKCSRGTYVRSLCHEVGQRFGCGASLASLRRTAVGFHNVEAAAPVDAFVNPKDVLDRLVPIENAVDLPQTTVNTDARRLVVSGTTIGNQEIIGQCPITEGWLQLKDESGKLLALATVATDKRGLCIHPKRVLAS